MTIMKQASIFSVSITLLLLTACSAPVAKPAEQKKAAIEVRGQTVSQSKSANQQYEYPALVLSQQEAKVIAKTSGTVKQVNFKLGESVKVGSLLARIDDINQGGSYGAGLSANQIRQAQLAVEQAEINKRNIALTSAESLKSVQISYEAAKIATEQARLNLVNRETGITQSTGDVETNANATADAVADTCNTLITEINNLTGYDKSNIDYLSTKYYLGLADPQLAMDAKNYYKSTVALNQQFSVTDFTDLKTKIEATIKLVQTTKKLIEYTNSYIGASVTSNILTQTAIDGMQTVVGGYLAQINAALTQINGAKQALENNAINNNTNSDALTKAYELAKQQEKNAQQALFSQQANTKSMLDAAEVQYRNALISLQSIIDVHLVVAPLSGKITQSFIALGDTVSAGQQLATISSGQTMKFQFYVDETVLRKIKAGQTVVIKNNENKEIAGEITGVTTQADAFTKRFLVEVAPIKFNSADFSLGTVVNILINVEKKSDTGNIVLPLSAIEIGQNGNMVFTIDNGQAKKISVEIIKITGETAEIKTNLPDTAVIITDGNKLVQEGDPVELIK